MSVQLRIHGSPYDRGAADSYYCRRYKPHYYADAPVCRVRMEVSDMTQAQIAEYREGWLENERNGDHKDWG